MYKGKKSSERCKKKLISKVAQIPDILIRNISSYLRTSNGSKMEKYHLPKKENIRFD
jgi:hypothetical protein